MKLYLQQIKYQRTCFIALVRSSRILSMKYFSYLLFSIILISVGCKKGWLEEKTDKSLAVPSTLSDFQGLLDYLQTMTFAYPNLAEVASDGHYISDAIFSGAVNNLVNKDAYTWSKTVPHIGVGDWNNSYAKILVDNIILDGLNKINPGSQDQEWNNIRGQALFHRSRLFFELMQTYAPAYNPTTAANDLGIVLRLSSDITIPSKRSTVKEAYEQILNDLNEAKGLLPARPQILTRGSASAANALLSRVYLSMNDFGKAYVSADDCLKQYSQLIDYNTISASATYIGLYNKEVLFHSIYGPFVGSFSAWRIDKNLIDLYMPGDLRRTRFYRLNTADGSYSFKGNYESRSDNLFCGLATDEVYLTRAECNARAGHRNEALKDLNDLMITRWDKNVPYPPITANTADEALTKILTERKKELIFRGVRWMDLRRLNQDPRFAVTLTRIIGGKTYTLEPNSYKYTLPIPDDIIQATGMQQNPEWP